MDAWDRRRCLLSLALGVAAALGDATIARAAPALEAAGEGATLAPPPRGSFGLRLALQTETAFGATVGPFRNHLAGARLDYRFSPEVSLGGYLGYANLKGQDGRAHAVLPYVQLEYLAGRGELGPLSVPLRFATGYLPRNGPVVRVSGGLAYPLGRRVDLVADLLAPMAWVTHDQVVFSLNVALELVIKTDPEP